MLLGANTSFAGTWWCMMDMEIDWNKCVEITPDAGVGCQHHQGNPQYWTVDASLRTPLLRYGGPCVGDPNVLLRDSEPGWIRTLSILAFIVTEWEVRWP